MGSPKRYTGAGAPKELIDLIAGLMPLLLAGEDSTSQILREQHAAATIRDVELTGVGFFVQFAVPPDARRTDSMHIVGGGVGLQVESVEHGTGCVLFVRAGALSMLEGYTSGDAWPEHPVGVALANPCPLIQERR